MRGQKTKEKNDRKDIHLYRRESVYIAKKYSISMILKSSKYGKGYYRLDFQ